MSCNCPNPNTCPNLNDCRCGIILDIYNSGGSLIESTQASLYGSNDYFYDVQSGVWNDVLGQSYNLTIQYNTELGRWELSYFDNDLDADIVIGVLYGDETCPTYGCWDLDCISFVFQPRLIKWIITWNGEYLNGRKKYSSYFTDPGAGGSFTWDFFWDEAGRWTITRTPGDPFNWAYAYPDTECIPTDVTWYNYEFNNPTLFQTFPLGVTGYDLKTTAIDCGCCDTEVSVTLYDGEGSYTYNLTLSYDEYGNVLGLNGYNYYTYIKDEVQYYLYVNSEGNWVVNTLFNNSETEIAYTPVTDDCPFGSYTTNKTTGDVLACVDCVKVSFTYLGVNYEFEIPSVTFNEGKPLYSISGITVGPYTNADILISWGNTGSGLKWRFFFLGTGISEIPDDLPCPLGNFPDSTTPEALFTNIVISVCGSSNNVLVSVKGTECFDCCDYYAPRNRNLLKKKKAIFVDEIASIRNKEIFGLKCGPEWSDLFKKHLIFDVLWCLPYGVLCDDEEQCLINNLNENCNC